MPEVIYGVDGDQCTAVRPDFINLQESPCGFGATDALALKNLELQEGGKKLQAVEECCNCAFTMKVKCGRRKKLKCITSNAITQEHFTCPTFISKITLANAKAEGKV